MNLLDMGALAQSEALANRSLSAVELMEATLCLLYTSDAADE